MCKFYMKYNVFVRNDVTCSQFLRLVQIHRIGPAGTNYLYFEAKIVTLLPHVSFFASELRGQFLIFLDVLQSSDHALHYKPNTIQKITELAARLSNFRILKKRVAI